MWTVRVAALTAMVAVLAQGEALPDGTTLAPLVTSGITPFPTMPLPPGVTPTTVSHNDQSDDGDNSHSDTATNPVSSYPIASPSSTRDGDSDNDSSSTSRSSSSSASQAAATTSSSTSTSAGAAVKHSAVPWAAEVVLAAVGVLAL